jgi:hypothetical protein
LPKQTRLGIVCHLLAKQRGPSMTMTPINSSCGWIAA